MEQDSLSFLKHPLPSWGGVLSDKRLRKPWQESETEGIASLQKSLKHYSSRHGEARLDADPEAKVNQGQTKKQQKSKALEALKKVAEEGKHSDQLSSEETGVTEILKDGLRDFIDDALDEAERYKRVDRNAVKIEFNWETVGNFNEFPALHRSRAENGPGKPYRGGNNANQFETPIFATADLGLILESPRDGCWSRFGGTAPVIQDILPGRAVARAYPRIKRGMRLVSVNGRSVVDLGPDGFRRLQDVRPLRLGVSSQPLDFAAGVGQDCQKLRPDVYARTMAVDFVRDFCASEEEKAARAKKKAKFDNTIPWSDSTGVPDLERRVTRLHKGLQQTGWPPGAQSRLPGSKVRAGSKLRSGSKGPLQVAGSTGSGLASRFASEHPSPGSSPTHAATPMSLSASAPNLQASTQSFMLQRQ